MIYAAHQSYKGGNVTVSLPIVIAITMTYPDRYMLLFLPGYLVYSFPIVLYMDDVVVL